MSEQRAVTVSKDSRAELEKMISEAAKIQQPLWPIVSGIVAVLQSEVLPKATAVGITVEEDWQVDWSEDFLDIATETVQTALYCNDDSGVTDRFTPARIVDTLIADVAKAKQSRKELAEWLEKDVALKAQLGLK